MGSKPISLYPLSPHYPSLPNPLVFNIWRRASWRIIVVKEVRKKETVIHNGYFYLPIVRRDRFSYNPPSVFDTVRGRSGSHESGTDLQTRELSTVLVETFRDQFTGKLSKGVHRLSSSFRSDIGRHHYLGPSGREIAKRNLSIKKCME